MGINIELQTERGEVLERVTDSQNLVGRFLPPNDNWDCPMLASIDPYGDTIFNRVQMDRFLREWRALGHQSDSDAQSLVWTIEQMAVRCRDEVHLYLKFVGD